MVPPQGIVARSPIFVLANTNRPEHIDAALRRPGRSNRVVRMGLPYERDRAKSLSATASPAPVPQYGEADATGLAIPIQHWVVPERS
jgi:SpoVK/Ycf46/Vps4 family AAA+-type ATPase